MKNKKERLKYYFDESNYTERVILVRVRILKGYPLVKIEMPFTDENDKYDVTIGSYETIEDPDGLSIKPTPLSINQIIDLMTKIDKEKK